MTLFTLACIVAGLYFSVQSKMPPRRRGQPQVDWWSLSVIIFIVVAFYGM